MFDKDDLKKFFENANASRREFFDYIAKTTILAIASSLNLSLTEEGQAANIDNIGNIDVVSLINKECLLCYEFGLCILFCKKVAMIIIEPYISYKIPVGFAETGDAGQFGASSDKLSGLSYDYSYLKNDLVPHRNPEKKPHPHIPPGTRYLQVGQGQNKMQLYPHYYGFSPTMIKQIQAEFQNVNKGNPFCEPCLPAVLEEVEALQYKQVALPPVVLKKAQYYITKLANESKEGKKGPPKEFVEKFYGDEKLAKEIANDIKYVNEHFYKIAEDYNSAYASSQVLSVPSELFAFIWAIQELSPDEEKWKAIILAIQNAMQNGQIKPYELTCPHMYKLLMQNPEVAQAFAESGFDPTFICVGLWGNGYPRVGDVETVDPIVGGLLSIARWQNLIYSWGLVATPPQASWYQLYNPYIFEVGKNCFQPGWVFSDFTENNFNRLLCPEDGIILSAIQHIKGYPPASLIDDYFKDPELVVDFFMFNGIQNIFCQFGSIASGFSLGSLLKDLDPLTYRNVGVIVYQQHTRCCYNSKKHKDCDLIDIIHFGFSL